MKYVFLVWKREDEIIGLGINLVLLLGLMIGLGIVIFLVELGYD